MFYGHRVSAQSSSSRTGQLEPPQACIVGHQLQLRGSDCRFKDSLPSLRCVCAGIWSAALHGDLQRVRSLVQKGTHPNLKDTAGYTALVCVWLQNLL